MVNPVENLKADLRDIRYTVRKIVDRHTSSVRGLLGGKRPKLLKR